MFAANPTNWCVCRGGQARGLTSAWRLCCGERLPPFRPGGYRWIHGLAEMNMMPGGWSHLGHESGAVPKQHPNNGGVRSSGGAGGKAAERVALVPVPLRESGAGV